MRAPSTFFAGFALLILSASAWADNNGSIQGAVIGIDGRLLAGTEVRAERLDAKAAPVTTKTDNKGHYVINGLPAGAYTISAFVKSVPKARVSVRTRDRGTTRVDLDLRTGKNVAAKPPTAPVNTSGTEDLSRIQGRIGNNINNMSFPGH